MPPFTRLVVPAPLYEALLRQALDASDTERRRIAASLHDGVVQQLVAASFTAAGTAYATHGINTIPFFIFYSMFGF